MKHIEYYEADDGTRFDDELECEAYEANKEFTNIDNHLEIFNENFSPVIIGGVDDDSWQNEAEYFIMYDDKGFDYLLQCEHWTGLRLVHRPCENPDYPLILRYEEDNVYGTDITKEWNKWDKLYKRLKMEVI